MVPQIIRETILDLLKDHGKNVTFRDEFAVSGGSINDTYAFRAGDQKYFLKYNIADRYPGMFERESDGLAILRNASAIRVPEVKLVGKAGKYSFLLMEHIETKPMKRSFWADFGRKLAALHRVSSRQFGLDKDNYIGSLPQRNSYRDDWASFFRQQRLEIQAGMARDSGLLTSSDLRRFDRLFGRLEDIFPAEPPSLIHGDLWSGNYMVDDRGEACIVDPAVYFGHREMDLAMSRLFGVFDSSFYLSYNHEYPLEKGWMQRVDICNLYPLLVHVNLFGEGYVGSVRSIISRF